ncbi:group II intron reverse transcriptase/maturase [Candidatus Poribacteria bacterium]|nr:group II intron reverse transcriptase/maturase [Candidatus Poribacteria bacterium]
MSAYQLNGDYLFTAENIRNCERKILSIQRRMDKAVADKDKDSIRESFNLLTRKSNAVRVLSVWKITQRNQGKYTAGVDGIAIPKMATRQEQNAMRLRLLDNIDIFKKPDQIKRVYIPKPNGKKRPLGIPTLHDRIVQDILRIAIDPIAEYHFSHNSFGFRPKRSCQDAQMALFLKLSTIKSKRYVIEGDIKGCFDNINHNHILETLANWAVPKWSTELIGKILKTDIFHNGEIYCNDTGTPQGGVISPLLANVALTALDNFCYEKYGYKRTRKSVVEKVNPIIRYADDFVVICVSEKEAVSRKSEIADFLQTIGLTLSEEKTKITHITKGFNFLGFNFRKYKKKGKLKATDNKWENYILLIKPEKEKVLTLLRNCKKVLSEAKTATQEHIILLLNPKLIGWGMYYRHCVAKNTFQYIDREMWQKVYRWAKRRHSNKSKSWVINKYFSRVGKIRAMFRDKEKDTTLFRLSSIPIKRFVKVKNNIRVYNRDPETIEYWNKREYTNAYNQIFSVKMHRLYKQQKGICPHCKGQITQSQIQDTDVHIHHLKPVSFGGSNDYSNLRLLHTECHRELHRIFTSQVMSKLSDNNIDYIKNRKQAIATITNWESRVR